MEDPPTVTFMKLHVRRRITTIFREGIFLHFHVARPYMFHALRVGLPNMLSSWSHHLAVLHLLGAAPGLLECWSCSVDYGHHMAINFYLNVISESTAWSTRRTDAMAREMTVRQLSGEEDSFVVSTHTTIREFKRQLHAWLPCEDESKRNMSSVEVVVGDKPLLNKEEPVLEAVPGTEVLAFLSIQPVVCSRFQASGRKVEDLLVVEIPNSVTGIGDHAFEDCSSLASISIPNSMTNIGSGAFQGCSSLASVGIPNSVTWIGDCAFKGCSSLASVTIPNSVILIGNRAFAGCSSFGKCDHARLCHSDRIWCL